MTVLLVTLLALLGDAHPNDGPDVDLRIRIEDDKVVFQIMMNLVFCDEIVKVDREVPHDLHPDEEEPLEQALIRFYTAQNQVAIDGVLVTPKATGWEAPEPEHSLLPLFPRFGMQALFKVRLELTYIATSPPQSVRMAWGPFPPDYALGFENEVPPMEVGSVILAQGEEEVIIFLKEEPEYTWHRSDVEPEDRFLPVPMQRAQEARLDVPIISAVVLGILLVWGAALVAMGRLQLGRRAYRMSALIGIIVAAAAWPLFRVSVPSPFGGETDLPSDAEALEIFKPLHANIYRAFHYTGESDIYDALARSVDGDLLEDLYNEIYRSLIMQEEGGAVSRVQEVRMMESEVEEVGTLSPGDAEGFRVLARWQVDGAVFHWGHSHERTNEYEARYTVVRAAEGWRIAGSQTLEQRLVGATIPVPVKKRGREGGGK